MPSRQAVLDGRRESVAEVQRAGDVGRRDDHDEALARRSLLRLGGVAAVPAARLPPVLPRGLDVRGVVRLRHGLRQNLPVALGRRRRLGVDVLGLGLGLGLRLESRLLGLGFRLLGVDGPAVRILLLLLPRRLAAREALLLLLRELLLAVGAHRRRGRGGGALFLLLRDGQRVRRVQGGNLLLQRQKCRDLGRDVVLGRAALLRRRDGLAGGFAARDEGREVTAVRHAVLQTASCWL
mmetsp:Transcript_20250/g.60469  ORF Transcript_20250/g.60469 Transcript_20250/m.60469 type:complete len:237 (-) Transcript_20250:113-823(-)